jgi:hypothetical protein
VPGCCPPVRSAVNIICAERGAVAAILAATIIDLKKGVIKKIVCERFDLKSLTKIDFYWKKVQKCYLTKNFFL